MTLGENHIYHGVFNHSCGKGIRSSKDRRSYVVQSSNRKQKIVIFMVVLSGIRFHGKKKNIFPLTYVFIVASIVIV